MNTPLPRGNYAAGVLPAGARELESKGKVVAGLALQPFVGSPRDETGGEGFNQAFLEGRDDGRARRWPRLLF